MTNDIIERATTCFIGGWFVGIPVTLILALVDFIPFIWALWWTSAIGFLLWIVGVPFYFIENKFSRKKAKKRVAEYEKWRGGVEQ